MQSSLGKALRKEFARQKDRALPTFVPDKTALVPPGWRVFRWSSSVLSFFVVLCFSPKDDRFTIELGWSEDGALPPSGGMLPNDVPKLGRLSFRLSRLWQLHGFDHWWVLGRQRSLEEMANFVPDQPAEEKLSDVEPQIADAFEKVVTFGLAYFEKIATEKGVAAQFNHGGHIEKNRYKK